MNLHKLGERRKRDLGSTCEEGLNQGGMLQEKIKIKVGSVEAVSRGSGIRCHLGC